MYTAADEKREEAKDHLKKAADLLSEMRHAWGWDEYTPGFRTAVQEAIVEIDKIREKT
jgi:hypothetical protein